MKKQAKNLKIETKCAKRVRKWLAKNGEKSFKKERKND